MKRKWEEVLHVCILMFMAYFARKKIEVHGVVFHNDLLPKIYRNFIKNHVNSIVYMFLF